jgi:hypothetical protein
MLRPDRFAALNWLLISSLLTAAAFYWAQGGTAAKTDGRATGDLKQFWRPDSYLDAPAWTFVAPASWRMEGGVYWTGRLVPLAYCTDLRITAPDGLAQVRMFPYIVFTDTNSVVVAASRTMSPVLEPVEFLRKYLIPSFRPEARNYTGIGREDTVRQLEADAGA